MISKNVLNLLPLNERLKLSKNILMALAISTEESKQLQNDQMLSSDDYDNAMDERLAFEHICKKIKIDVSETGEIVKGQESDILESAEIVLTEFANLLKVKNKTSKLTIFEMVETIAEKNVVNRFNAALDSILS